MTEGSTHNNIVSGNATAINAESIPVPDPADTIRAALARVPRPDPH
ncbi:hypothetical protein AB0N16_34865 [Streptomyces sp. NPDC051105]